MVKKNFHGGLKLLLLPLFIMLFASFSTCYADELEFNYTMLNDLTIEEWDTILTYVINNSGVQSSFKNNWNNITETNKTTGLTTFKNLISEKVRDNPLLNVNLHHVLICFDYQTNYIYFLITQQTDNIDVSTPDSLYNVLFKYKGNPDRNNTSYNYGNENGFLSFNYFRVSYGTRLNSYFGTSSASNEISYYPSSNDTLSADNTYSYFQSPFVFGFTYGDLKPTVFTTTYNDSSSYLGRFNLNNIKMNVKGYSPEPEEPSGDDVGSGDTPINPSGEDGSGNNNDNINYTPILDNINTNISNQGTAIINNQNENTDKIINSISGETNKIINNITNTDTDVNVSGELSNMLSSTDNIVDPTINFFSWLLDNIRSVLNSTGDYDLNITLFDKTYTIRSDFFELPDGDLKTFLQMSFLAWFGWDIIKKVRYIVYAIKCVNISSALNAVDFNPDIL